MAIMRQGEDAGGIDRRGGMQITKAATEKRPAKRNAPEKVAAKKHAAKKHAAKKHAAKKHAAKKHAAKKHAAEKQAAEKQAAEKHAAKKHAARKHAAKKHAARKHATAPAGKHASKHAAKSTKHPVMPADVSRLGRDEDDHTDHEIAKAYHHLQRAAAVISLLEQQSGSDLRMLLEHGITLYRQAAGKKDSAACAHGLLRAAEHLGMAGLYTARSEYRVEVAPPPRGRVAKHLSELGPRLERLPKSERENARRLEAMAHELLRRAESSGHDPHLEYELTMAADGICTALEEGM